MTIAELPFPTIVPRPVSAGRLAELPVAIIGAGPVGLAAAQLLERGIDVVVYEAGASAGAAVASWGHTGLFTPWRYLVDDAAKRMLERTGWQASEPSVLPLGSELVERYLLPLAATPELAPSIRYGSRVSAVSRQGMDRTRSGGRAGVPFLLRVERDDETSEQLARAVIDAFGTYSSPNALASSGLDPAHLDEVCDAVTHALPDVLGADRASFAGRRAVIVGAGHSAANTLLKLATLVQEHPGTAVTWGCCARSASRSMRSSRPRGRSHLSSTRTCTAAARSTRATKGPSRNELLPGVELGPFVVQVLWGRGSYFWRTTWRSIDRVTSSPRVTPPASSAAFQLTP